jgi:hypothetical protein
MAQVCKFCQGKGAVQFNPSLPPVPCPVCGGTGTQEDPGLFFIYEFTFQLAANAVSVQQSLNILNNDFKWMFAMAVSTGFFSVKLSDGSTQRQFSNQEVHVSNLFGTAQNPFPLLTPYTFKRKGQIQAIASDLSGGINNVRMAFAGVELSS